jgi:uncharacterized protein (TIGR00252 family)
MSRPNSNSSQTPNTQQIGTWGEQLVAQWLCGQGWQILHHQYRTRWGEIDLIALHPGLADVSGEATLIFVEVKTRSRRNWDHEGSLAITSTKQEKLITSAQYFISQFPELANYPCRFDVGASAMGSVEFTRPSLHFTTSSCFPHRRISSSHYIGSTREPAPGLFGATTLY